MSDKYVCFRTAIEDCVRLIPGKDEVVFALSYDFMIDGEVHTIPVGFVSDLSSIPKIFHTPLFIHPFHYTVRRAGAIHDYLYSIGYPRLRADSYYAEVSREDGANYAQTVAMKYSLYSCGWLAYNKTQEA